MKTYNVGIIGFGFIGKVHAYGYLNLPLFYDPVPLAARITHVCTSRKETACKGAAQVGAEHAVTDYRAITENPNVDIVHVCTPNHLHKDALLSAMAHGKHIYCDKPLTARLVEAEAIAAALPGYRGTAQMTFQNRFFPATMRAKLLVDEGFLGQVLQYRAAYLHAGSADPDAPLKWKLSREAGGGVIADLASHAMDLMHHLLGDYAALCADTHTAYAQRSSPGDRAVRVAVDAEDAVAILTRMKRGGPGVIEASKIATGSEDELRFEIHGSQGALRFNGTNPNQLDVYDAALPDEPLGGRRGWARIDAGQRYPAPAARFPGPKFSLGWIRTHVACLANFLTDIGAGRPGDPGLGQGLYIQHLIDCAQRSAGRRAWLDVDPPPERPVV